MTRYRASVPLPLLVPAAIGTAFLVLPVVAIFVDTGPVDLL